MNLDINYHMKKSLMAVILCTAILCGCGNVSGGAQNAGLDGKSDGAVSSFAGKNMQTSTLFAMDTVMELQIQGDEELLREGEALIRSLEKELSVTDENSEIARLNKDGKAALTEDVAELMGKALDICDSTDGALDITIYPVLKTWGFTTGEYRVPADEEIQELLENVDYHGVDITSFDATIDSDELSDAAGIICEIPSGTQVDLGSVAKGYTSMSLYNLFTDKGVTSGLINLGGNVQCIGSKINGDDWKVAVKSPFIDSSSGILGVLSVSDLAVVTSGGYERYFEENGKTYWHILDPKTGKPAENGLVSVTIIGKDGLLCDGLSTALFVKGLDEAIRYYQGNRDKEFDMVLVTDDREVYLTEGVADKFSLASEYYNLNTHIIK
ncbi:FAD:protein FMN transferase [Butyrivibrio proteoclasticus]|uniref:FAD:protein FMN transferase n=1 Tax=Butyrivibrio proteoclasticus TaxID=43305 RepID=UPI00047E27C4|nr:FAD:protein FMN transferase [Butyrivibrio proteoclasticus]